MSQFLDVLKDRGPLLGAYLAFNMPFTAHLMGRAGFDWVMVDAEHSPLSASETTKIVHAVSVGSHGRCLSTIRIPSHGVEYIKWALDSGANGIVVPMVNTKTEAELIVQRARYPPLGQRSFGPFNAPWADLSADSDVAKYFSTTSKDVLVLVMIESVEGVGNAEDILNTNGVSGVFIGPVDLRLSMGFAGADGDEDEYVAALNKIVKIAKRLNKPVGIFAASGDVLKKQIEMGFSVFLVGGDMTALVSGAQSVLTESKQAVRDVKL